MAFGDRLKAWRLDHGYLQKDLQKELVKIDYTGCEWKSGLISKWKMNRNTPNIYHICLISIITGKSIDWLFQDELNEIRDRRKSDILEKEQHKGCKYKYRKGNFICELTAI